MAGASGSPADLLVSLSILMCILLLGSATIRRFAASTGWKPTHITMIERVLRWSPLSLFVLLLLGYILDHMSLDMTSKHVTQNLTTNSSFLDRLVSLIAGADGSMLLMLSVLIMVHSITYRKAAKHVDNNVVDRWFALLWLCSLTTLLPPELFSIISDTTSPTIVTSEVTFSPFSSLAAFSMGIVLGFSPHVLSASNRGHHLLIFLHGIIGLVLLFTFDMDILFPLAGISGNDWPASILSLPESERFASFIGIWLVFTLTPVVMAQSAQLDMRYSAGKRRWVGLGVSLAISLLILISSAFLTLHGDWSIQSISSALLQELFPLLFFAAAFCLLPVMGMDERARPELHGWRLGLLVGLLTAGFVGRPISLAMSAGWLLSLLVATWLPLTFEVLSTLESRDALLSWSIPLLGCVLLFFISTFVEGILISLMAIGVFALISSIFSSSLPKLSGENVE